MVHERIEHLIKQSPKHSSSRKSSRLQEIGKYPILLHSLNKKEVLNYAGNLVGVWWYNYEFTYAKAVAAAKTYITNSRAEKIITNEKFFTKCRGLFLWIFLQYAQAKLFVSQKYFHFDRCKCFINIIRRMFVAFLWMYNIFLILSRLSFLWIFQNFSQKSVKDTKIVDEFWKRA